MTYKHLFISDLDETLQHAHQPLTSEQVNILEKIIRKNTFISIITGSSTQSVYERVCNKIDPSFYKSIVYYSNNGAICFQIEADGSIRYLYNYASEFDLHKNKIEELVLGYFYEKELGKLEFKEGKDTEINDISIEHKECQVTITLRGFEHLRRAITKDLSNKLDDIYKGQIIATVAGSKSIDIVLASKGKKHAVNHLLELGIDQNYFSEKTQVVIAGDSFHSGGADKYLLHKSLKGATVFCAGKSIPKTSLFSVIQPPQPSHTETYKFLRTYFAI